MILVIDNYDSFVHNLARYLNKLGQETVVARNDAIDVDASLALRPSAIVLSPGPCTPNEAGCSLELVRRLAGQIPLLGVCLGHQTIAQAFGGTIVRGEEPMHGRSSLIEHFGTDCFAGLPSPMTVGRYHSLIVERGTLPACLQITAQLADGTVMAVAHREYRVAGLQFHPESILTEHGFALLANFLRWSGVAGNVPRLLLTDEWQPRTIAPRPIPQQPVTF